MGGDKFVRYGKSVKRRPPRKICQVCGTEFYAYGRTTCARCWAERGGDRSELVRVIKSEREVRLGTRAEAIQAMGSGPKQPAEPPAQSLSYGELPEGY